MVLFLSWLIDNLLVCGYVLVVMICFGGLVALKCCWVVLGCCAVERWDVCWVGEMEDGQGPF